MSIVIIAEKPSVAEDLASVLGVGKKLDTHWHSEDIIITWAIGHLLELKYMDDYDDAFKNWRGTVDRLQETTVGHPETHQGQIRHGNRQRMRRCPRRRAHLSDDSRALKSQDTDHSHVDAIHDV